VEGAERTRDIVDGLKRFSAADRDENIEFNLAETMSARCTGLRAPPDQFPRAYRIAQRHAVFGSPGQIQQVITNLVQNASDATEKCPILR